MLRFLHIENVALIKQLDFDFESGFTVLTGETGSGKSMIISALNMVLGQRAPKDIIRNGEDECYIYALFDNVSDRTKNALFEMGIEADEEGMYMLSRRLNLEGRSTFKINNRTVPVSLIKDVSSYLVSLNEQHDSYSLLNSNTHYEYLDSYSNSEIKEHQKLSDDYKKAYHRMKECREKLDALTSESDQREERLEFLKYQKNEIESAKIKVGEEDALLLEKEKIKNSALISNAVRGTLTLLSGSAKPGAYDKLSGAVDNLEKIKDIVDGGEALYQKLSSMLDTMSESIKEISRIDIGISDDPIEALDRIESRLDLISKIKNKYGESEEEVIEKLNSISNTISEIELYDFKLAEYTEDLKRSLEECEKCGRALRRSREEGAKKLSKLINDEFLFLDMEKVLFKVEFTPYEKPSEKGLDEISFYIRTNSGEPFKKLSEVSSGGELSRIMLALKKVLSECDDVDSIIFDEIDTGVSGKTSSKIGISLKTLSRNHQVISITHSAQVSAIAHHHLKVYKSEKEGRTYTSITQLQEDERVEEIARILGGVTITESVIRSARELIEQGKNN